MIFADQKKKENIAEYVIYMFQVEDIVRAANFSLEVLDEQIISKMSADEADLINIRAWYKDVIAGMKKQNVEEEGHLEMVKEVITELSYLHNSLLTVHNDDQYKQIYHETIPSIREFQQAAGQERNLSDMEACLAGLYAKLMMRIQGKDLGPKTEAATEAFRKLMAHLSAKYKEMQSGSLHHNLN